MSGERGHLHGQRGSIITVAEVRQLVERYLDSCLRSGVRPRARGLTTCISKNCYYDRDDLCRRFRALHDVNLKEAIKLVARALEGLAPAEGAEADGLNRGQ